MILRDAIEIDNHPSLGLGPISVAYTWTLTRGMKGPRGITPDDILGWVGTTDPASPWIVDLEWDGSDPTFLCLDLRRDPEERIVQTLNHKAEWMSRARRLHPSRRAGFYGLPHIRDYYHWGSERHTNERASMVRRLRELGASRFLNYSVFDLYELRQDFDIWEPAARLNIESARRDWPHQTVQVWYSPVYSDTEGLVYLDPELFAQRIAWFRRHLRPTEELVIWHPWGRQVVEDGRTVFRAVQWDEGWEWPYVLRNTAKDLRR